MSASHSHLKGWIALLLLPSPSALATQAAFTPNFFSLCSNNYTSLNTIVIEYYKAAKCVEIPTERKPK
ncbi:hypothetical protein HCEG_05805 [Histoplasma capsulatum var. duboisii H88]|uniref:Uncharacterized protein n=1 Tax=Ajellomyces capsulatus (strain H88) TaxID=544711 RepID=F0UJJ9_AJEC8|nr:hypothetical protein HCEG_05805 [Histoplasma capsulatum var. duboisii H88]QSS57209.1 hypothetical protein I7I53_05621 [Histoplasma capsulatum var. duboisii H88]